MTRKQREAVSRANAADLTATATPQPQAPVGAAQAGQQQQPQAPPGAATAAQKAEAKRAKEADAAARRALEAEARLRSAMVPGGVWCGREGGEGRLGDV